MYLIMNTQISNNGALIIRDGVTVVRTDRLRFNYAKPVPTRIAVDHPILGRVTAKCSFFNYDTPEVRYFPVNGEGAIYLNLFPKQFSHPWCEWHSEKEHHPWCLEIIKAWNILNRNMELAAPIVWSKTVEMRILVENYPTVSGEDRKKFWVIAQVPHHQLPWYNKDLPHADGSKNNILAVTEDDSQEVDLCVYFAPDSETYSGYPRREMGVYFPPARPLN
jgi:hypothetical protein